MNRKSVKRRDFKSIEIDKEDGLKISYNKKELKKHLPHMIKEIYNQNKSIKIDSVDYKVEEIEKKKNEKDLSNPEELTNPTVLDFIRRCSTNKEAIEILEYLLKRKEISNENYDFYKKEIEKKEGLRNLIEMSGGVKKPGYYLRKYYYRIQNNKKEIKLPKNRNE